MSTTVEAIKERLSIVDVVGVAVKLERAGSNLRAKCPFHQEKTPSFFVSPTRGTFYCFGCGAKGDIFSFVEQFDGVDFSGALKTLAEKAGVPLRFEKAHERDLKEKLREVLEEAARYFEEHLVDGDAPYQYLQKRGLTDETIKSFRIGYALPEWRSLKQHLAEKGFSEEAMEKAGLVKITEGKSYDRFRGRIMFPLFDPSGRIIAFSGRIFEDGGQKAKVGETLPAKYVNSPETLLFSKSHVLYGFDRAKESIRRHNFTILVEGQMDLLMSHQMGYTNTAALSGTALTDWHLTMLERLSDRLILSFDSDDAGIAATGRSATLGLKRGFDVKAVRIEGGKDPADLILSDKEAWKKAVREAVHVVDFFLDIVARKSYSDRKFQMEVSRVVLPFVVGIRSSIDRAHFVKRIASRLGVPESAVAEEVSRMMKQEKGANRGFQTVVPPKESIRRKEMILRSVAGFILSVEAKDKSEIPIEAYKKQLIAIVGEPALHDLIGNEGLRESLIFEAEEKTPPEDVGKLLDDLLLELKRETLKESFEGLVRELREKEREGNSAGIEDLLIKCRQISKDLSALDNTSAS